MGFLVLILAVCLIVIWTKYKSADYDLTKTKEKITEVDAYVNEQHAAADAYFTEQTTAADQYALEKQTAADQYASAQHAAADTYFTEQINAGNLEKSRIAELKKERKEITEELAIMNADILTEAVKIDAYDNMKSDEIKNELSILRSRQDDLVHSEAALTVATSGAKRAIINSQKKQILRCFNSECANILGNVTVKNVDTSRGKIQRSYNIINKIFAIDGVQISQDYLASKFEELSLVYAYMLKEDEEREQRKAIREQMVEEEKVRREIEREKQKIAKEEAQFSNEVKKLMSYMQKAKDDVERQLYLDKISDLEAKLKALSADKENILQREQNTRAGFVYIISNIGSFGENIYKIGMTRRLEPMDRINELSSASVPFPFDVHAMIFSDDAPALETILHQTFKKFQVNKVNPRKEFFHVDLNEVKKVVLANHNATVKFIDIPDAVEYRETLKMQQ